MRLKLGTRMGIAILLLSMFGTSTITTTAQVREKVRIPYKMIERDDPELKMGMTKTIKKGVNGRKTETWRVKSFWLNGREISRTRISSRILRLAKARVLAKGTLRTFSETEAIPFSTEYIYGEGLGPGESRIKQNGLDGVRKKTFEIGFKNGGQTLRRLIDETVTAEPMAKIVAISRQSGYSANRAASEAKIRQKLAEIIETRGQMLKESIEKAKKSMSENYPNWPPKPAPAPQPLRPLVP